MYGISIDEIDMPYFFDIKNYVLQCETGVGVVKMNASAPVLVLAEEGD